jgi:hypothetical protein
MMEDEISKITDEITKSYPKEIGRRNELSNGVRIALRKIANRVDQGFNIEIRVEVLAETEENLSPEKEKEVDDLKLVREMSKGLQYVNPTGETILELNEGEVDENFTKKGSKERDGGIGKTKK